MKKIFKILLIFLFTVNFSAYCQKENSYENHQVILQFGGITYGSLTVKYAYKVKETEKYVQTIGIGFGHWYNLDLFGFLNIEHGRKYDVSYTILKRRNNNNYFDFEFGLIFNETISVSGIAFKNKLNKHILPEFRYHYNILPNIHVGYRFQNNKGPLFLRIGMGTPEIMKFSIGIRFL